MQQIDREVTPPGKNLPATKEDSARLDEMLNRRGVSKQEFQILSEVIFPEVAKAESILLAFDYCKYRKLDIFKRPVHIVPVWNKKKGCMVDTIWPGIAETRITAHRTGLYAGCKAAEFGPRIEHTFSKGSKLTFPQWCRITVQKVVTINGKQEIRDFVGPEVEWLEEYANEGRNSDAPNAMWSSRPKGQLEKCAETAALKRAFPEECGDAIEHSAALEVAAGPSMADTVASVEEIAQEMASANAGADDGVIEAELVEPTHQERMAAAAVVAEQQGAPAEVVEKMKEAAKGISPKLSNELMKAGSANGWTIPSVLAEIDRRGASEGYDKKNWNKEMTERQYNSLLEHIKANKPDA